MYASLKLEAIVNSSSRSFGSSSIQSPLMTFNSPFFFFFCLLPPPTIETQSPPQKEIDSDMIAASHNERDRRCGRRRVVAHNEWIVH